MSARGRWGDAAFWHPLRSSPCGTLEAPACDVATSVCGRSCRIRSRRAAIPSESSSSSSSSFSSSLLGESSSNSPPRLDLAQHFSSAYRSRFFFFSFFLSASLTDFCFSAEARLFSRSASSSFPGGFEDRASMGPCRDRHKS